MNGTSGVRRQGDADQTGGKTGEDFLIVGIGASAGGIQALKEFFQNVSADSRMAYVVILHLSPDHDSQLAEILQTVMPIPISQVRDESVRVEPNHVYVIPPNKSLAMNDGHLALSPIQSCEERRAPVDIFFRALAESHDSRAVSVILSGMGADGSMGMKRVKEKGGIVIVQDPREAEYDDMPKNSLAAGLVDYVVEDDGKGFNLRTAIGPKDRGIGLINMRERASFVGGTLEIESKKGVGTTLFVRVPIQEVSHE